MLDDDDFDYFVLFSNPTSMIGLAVFIAISVVLFVVVRDNEKDCAKQTCQAGLHPELLSHRCLCVGAPSPAPSLVPVYVPPEPP